VGWIAFFSGFLCVPSFYSHFSLSFYSIFFFTTSIGLFLFSSSSFPKLQNENPKRKEAEVVVMKIEKWIIKRRAKRKAAYSIGTG